MVSGHSMNLNTELNCFKTLGNIDIVELWSNIEFTDYVVEIRILRNHNGYSKG